MDKRLEKIRKLFDGCIYRVWDTCDVGYLLTLIDKQATELESLKTTLKVLSVGYKQDLDKQAQELELLRKVELTTTQIHLGVCNHKFTDEPDTLVCRSCVQEAGQVLSGLKEWRERNG